MNAHTPRESAEREQIARIISPQKWDFAHMPANADVCDLMLREEFAKADAILAALASLTRLRELEPSEELRASSKWATAGEWLAFGALGKWFVESSRGNSAVNVCQTLGVDAEDNAAFIARAVNFARAAITSRGSGA